MTFKLSTGLAAAAIALGLCSAASALAAPMPINVKDDAGKAMMGDPVKGAEIFKRCMVCHSIKAGENRIGPSLHGVVGRPAGSVPKFSYSSANKKSGIIWTAQEIFTYLKNPQKLVPGTKMSFPGIPNPQERADVIAYLEENSK
jgi:cytochrome c